MQILYIGHLLIQSHLYEFIRLKSHRGLNKQLCVFNVVLECGDVDITEWHVVLGHMKNEKIEPEG